MLLWLVPLETHAEGPLVSLEADVGLPVTKPQSHLFGPGGSLAVGVLYPLAPQFLVGGRVRVVGLLDGESPDDPGQVDPDMGTLEVAELAVRIRPLADRHSSRGLGLFVDGGFGGGLTGDVTRAAFEAGLGIGFDAGGFALAPTVRYLQVVQPDSPLSDEDARILLGGVELIFGGQVAPPVVQRPPPKKPTDRDRDGLADVEDGCPDDPEDHDGHADEDGCPDPDNDGDGIPDVDDGCPDEAEDFDEFADADGCPDLDNDEDSFPDDEDDCPNEAEIVNGNKDYDGCPDEGLIEFKNDRIVLEERVLFDLERARVKRAARPILKAIVQLQAQHPEWLSIRIEGHADKRGNEDYNVRLSERRAKNVRDWLVRLGIPANLIESVGYGSGRPRDLRDDPEAHQRNRRVEFVVLARQGPEPVPAEEEDAGEPPGDQAGSEATDPAQAGSGDSEAAAGGSEADAAPAADAVVSGAQDEGEGEQEDERAAPAGESPAEGGEGTADTGEPAEAGESAPPAMEDTP